jgi:hypothetical protein
MSHRTAHPGQKTEEIMNRAFISLCALVLATAGALLLASGATAGQPKVLICHKGRIIDVAAPSVPAHLAHGDTEVTTEVCDGVDNDCNGEVDEGGVCSPAILGCTCFDVGGFRFATPTMCIGSVADCGVPTVCDEPCRELAATLGFDFASSEVRVCFPQMCVPL